MPLAKDGPAECKEVWNGRVWLHRLRLFEYVGLSVPAQLARLCGYDVAVPIYFRSIGERKNKAITNSCNDDRRSIHLATTSAYMLHQREWAMSCAGPSAREWVNKPSGKDKHKFVPAKLTELGLFPQWCFKFNPHSRVLVTMPAASSVCFDSWL